MILKNLDLGDASKPTKEFGDALAFDLVISLDERIAYLYVTAHRANIA
jgi:hypothetical protein